MANKKVTDLGISNYMKEIVSNKPKVDNKEVVSLENSEGNSPEDTTETVVRNEKATSEFIPAVENNDSDSETLLRNAILTPETLFRLEQLKKLKNSTAKKGERISYCKVNGWQS